MLKLRRLSLSGFKSFVDDCDIDFAPGITAIVGPNGCGKSNLADAISWALGEQSAKSLRSGVMEDVIFNGSEERKPLGMASVELVLETDPSFEHAEDGRLTIGRQVYRGGKGVYQLNGETVRLKDTRDLLMDTGLGARTYAIIEQGKIGLILSGKPQERRELIEEAAGVTRYKERRRVAELKLEDATANLHRLDDIVSEVERSLRSLKRQAGAARRYRDAQRRQQELVEQVLHARWRQLHDSTATLERRLQRQTDEEAAAATELSRLESALAEERQAADSMSDEVSVLHDEDAALAARVEGRQEFVRGGRERLSEIDERLAAGRRTAAAHRDDIADSRDKRQRLEERRVELVGDLESARERVAGDESALVARGSSLSAATSEVERLRTRATEAEKTFEEARDELHRLRVDSERAQVQAGHLDAEIDDHAAELEEAAEAEAAAADRLEELESRLQVKVADRDDRTEELDEILARETELTHRQQSLADELSASRQRHQVLGELEQAQRESRRQIEETVAAAGIDSPRFLADLVVPPAGWERAVDHHLSDLADAVVLPPDRSAAEIAEALTDAGRPATLLSSGDDGDRTATVTDPAIDGPLATALGLEPEVAGALPPAYLVATVDDALRLAREHPNVAFVTRPAATASGGVVRLGGERRRPGALERRRELESLEERLPRLEDRLSEVRSEVDETVARRTERAQAINALEGEIAELQRQIAVAQARHEDTGDRIERLEEEGERYATERAEMEERLDELQRDRERQARRVDALEATHRDVEEELEAAVVALDELKSEREDLRTSEAARRGRVELLEERLRANELDLERLEQRVEEAEAGIARWQREEEELVRRRGELESSVDEAETELGEALEQRSHSQEALRSAREELDEKRGEIREREQRVRAARKRLDDARTALEETKVRRAGVEQDVEHLTASFQEHLDTDPPRPPREPESSEPPLDELEEELEECKRTIDRLGPVNLLAADEHAEQEERHAELEDQRADIDASVERLQQTIREIDRTSNERFAATFEEVNRHFGRVFERLFDGGQAEMRLLDRDNLLDSGVEIVARPPGKRLQSLTLLSGGEKALTAIALLFALFHTKPSPFCILDEVDAPLDEANTARFVDVLREMATDTQFIVITHNKLTMQAASTLYGVTMQERGVSTTVAVSLDDVQPEKELATA